LEPFFRHFTQSRPAGIETEIVDPQVDELGGAEPMPVGQEHYDAVPGTEPAAAGAGCERRLRTA